MPLGIISILVCLCEVDIFSSRCPLLGAWIENGVVVDFYTHFYNHRKVFESIAVYLG